MKQTKVHKEKRNVLVYLFSDLLAKGIPFLLLPIYTLYLTPDEFGNIAIYNVIVEILIIFVVFGANSYYRVEYFKHDNRPVLLTSLLTNVVTCLPAAALLMVLFIVFNLNPGDHSNIWLMSAVVVAFAQSITLLLIAEFQCQGNAAKVGIINLSIALITAIVTTTLLMRGIGEQARYWGFLVGSILVLVLGNYLYFSSQKVWLKPNKKISLPGLKFGLGVLPHALSWWARTGMDRMLIAKFVSVYQVGLYAIAAQISLILIVLANAVNQAFTPKIIKMLTDKDYRNTGILCIKVITIYLLIVLVLANSGTLIFSWFIDEKFAEAQQLLPLMCVVAFFQAIVTLLSNILYFFKKVKILSSITFCTSVLHVIIAFQVVQSYQVYGVIVSSIATYALSAVAIISVVIYLLKRELNGKSEYCQ